jgi:hypothetical protein
MSELFHFLNHCCYLPVFLETLSGTSDNSVSNIKAGPLGVKQNSKSRKKLQEHFVNAESQEWGGPL